MRPLTGPLRCTRGNHMAPREEFRYDNRGNLASWCKACKRDYDRSKRAADRAARDHHPSSEESSYAKHACD